MIFYLKYGFLLKKPKYLIFRVCTTKQITVAAHEMSSPVRTLGSWVRIPSKTRMSAFILFVLSCV
jgi:hypothetical protein